MAIEKKGMMFVLSSPSGAGKTTLAKKIAKHNTNFVISVSYTTRKPRSNEIDGKDYYFVNSQEFEDLVKKNYFFEYAKKNITVNCVSPGFIVSDMTMNIADKVKLYLTSRIPMGKLGTGEDVSNCVAFLSSEQASYVTGETVNVNGGMYMA